MEQAKCSFVLQVLDQRDSLSVKVLLAAGGGFEALDVFHKLAGEFFRARATLARPALSYQRPLLIYYDTGIRGGEGLDLAAIRFGELFDKLVKVFYLVGFAFGCRLSSTKILQDKKDRKSERHSVHDVKRRIDHADSSVVGLAEWEGQQALY
ncbi:MAG: hypothetical protein M3122_07240 [Actinomycetota bacterium]|nr:hypothetical protein [Actinomycetota bacterium]